MYSSDCFESSHFRLCKMRLFEKTFGLFLIILLTNSATKAQDLEEISHIICPLNNLNSKTSVYNSENRSNSNIINETIQCLEDFNNVCGAPENINSFKQWLHRKYYPNLTQIEVDYCRLRLECLIYKQFEWNNSVERLVINMLRLRIKPIMQAANLSVLVICLCPIFFRLHSRQPDISLWFELHCICASALLKHILVDVPNIVVRILMLRENDLQIEKFASLDHLGQITCCFMNFMKTTVSHFQNWLLLVSTWRVLLHLRKRTMKHNLTKVLNEENMTQSENMIDSTVRELNVLISNHDFVDTLSRASSFKRKTGTYYLCPKLVTK